MEFLVFEDSITTGEARMRAREMGYMPRGLGSAKKFPWESFSGKSQTVVFPGYCQSVFILTGRSESERRIHRDRENGWWISGTLFAVYCPRELARKA